MNKEPYIDTTDISEDDNSGGNKNSLLYKKNPLAMTSISAIKIKA